MSRDFIASQAGREFKRSPNRDRVTRGVRNLQNFFWCGSKGSETRLITAGGGNLHSAAFNPPGFWRGVYLSNQYLNDRFSVINYPNVDFGNEFGNYYPAGTKLRMVIDVVGFSTLYDPSRPYMMGQVTSEDPPIGPEKDVFLPGQQLSYIVDINYVDRGSVAYISAPRWQFPTVEDGWTAYEQALAPNTYIRERFNIGGVINGWVNGNVLMLNRHGSYKRSSQFWRKRITTTALATGQASLGFIPDFRPLNQSRNRRENSSFEWEATATALSTNMAALNPQNPINGRPVFSPLENTSYDPKFTELVWGRFAEISVVASDYPMVTTWEDVEV